MDRQTEAPIEKIRIIGIFAHIDAGKTTTSEAILYYTGRIRRIGSVDAGDTQLDWMEQERARGITITAAATTCDWRGHHINLIDTPGHIDFSAEVVRSMRVIDGAVIVMCGVGGVETQTETVWSLAEDENLPRLIFVNKLDRSGSSYTRVLEDIQMRLTPHAMAIQLPLGSEGSFTGLVDLLSQQALVWQPEAGEPAIQPIPAGMLAEVGAARERLVDAICETDETLLALRLDGRELPEADLRSALRRAVVAGKLVPVLCGSARNRIGIQPLLDAVVDYLPAPVDRQPVKGFLPGEKERPLERLNTAEAPFCAVSFKIVTDPHVGHLTWARAFSGAIRTGDELFIPRSGAQERVSRIYRIHANRREQVDTMKAGDVMALVGLKSAGTGDTLTQPSAPIQLEAFAFPQPVIAVALAPSTPDERDRLRQVLRRLCAEDPTLVLKYDAETQEELLYGMGELHLEIIVDRLRSEFDLIAKASPPQVAYRETVTQSARATGDYRKQSGGHGHYAVVRLKVEPLERGAGLVFENRAPLAEVPEGFVRSAQGGIEEALEKGILAGYPFTDVRVTIVGGRFHEIDSNMLDFRIAGSLAIRQAIRQAKPVLLEPIMRADIRVGEEQVGPVMVDVARRRGSVTNMQLRGSSGYINGEVPLAEARGYATDLRSLTQGKGSFTLEFQRYDIVPDLLAESIIDLRQRKGKVPKR